MFVLARDEMLRAATGDRAGAPPRDRAPGRAAGGVGGARRPAVSPSGHGARGPVAAPRPGGPPGPCHLARGARISWAGTVQTRVVGEARASRPEAWTAAGAPLRQGGTDVCSAERRVEPADSTTTLREN